MSEHQIHEFVAIDRPLTDKEMKELRAISTRAQISPRRFYNEYHWGDLKADPHALLARYFDVYLYAASWGERRYMVRLPADRVDLAALRAYVGGSRRGVLTKTGGHVILALDNAFGDHEPEYAAEIADNSALIGLRAGLLHGDMRVPYLAWLLAVQNGEIANDAAEPPVPPAICPRTDPLLALADFLDLDGYLLDAALAGATPPRDDPRALQRWVVGLARDEKDRWLTRAVETPDRAIGAELIAAFRKATITETASGRTARELRARAEALAEAADREAEQEAARQARRAEEARRERITALVRDARRTWKQIEALVVARNYRDAVALAADLHAGAVQEGKVSGFMASMTALEQRLSSRPGFFKQLRGQLKLAGSAVRTEARM